MKSKERRFLYNYRILSFNKVTSAQALSLCRILTKY